MFTGLSKDYKNFIFIFFSPETVPYLLMGCIWYCRSALFVSMGLSCNIRHKGGAVSDKKVDHLF